MKRSEFIKLLGIGATGLVLPGSAIQKKSIKIYNNYIKGLTHYDFKKVEKQLQKGARLQLKREGDNKYDRFAVAVHYKSYKLGYITAFENIVLANMLDQGVELNAQVSRIDRKAEIYEAVSVEIRANLIVTKRKLTQHDLLNKPADNAIDVYRAPDLGEMNT